MSSTKAPHGRGNPVRQTQLDLPDLLEQTVNPVQEAQTRVQEITFALAALAKEAAARVEAEACCIYVLDKRRQLLLPHSVWQLTDAPPKFAPAAVGQGIVGLAAQQVPNTVDSAISTQRLIRVDASNQQRLKPAEAELTYRSALAVPLALAAGEVVGVLLALNKIDALGFLPQDEQTLLNLTTQAAVALVIENLNLYRDKERRALELAALQHVSSELNSTFDLDKLLNLVLSEAVGVTRADSGSINLYEPIVKTFTYQVQGRAGSDLQPASAPAARQELKDRFLRSGRPILVADTFQDQEGTEQAKFRSRALIPILSGDGLAGIIMLESRQPSFFSQDQVVYLEALASQAAVAIRNAQTYQEQKQEREQASRRVDQLARLSEISNAFRTNQPLHEVLEDIAYAIVDSVGYEVVLISLVERMPPVVRLEVGAGVPIAQFAALRQSAVGVQPLSTLQTTMIEEFRLSNSFFIPAEKIKGWQDRLNIPYVEKQRPAGQPDELTGENGNIWQPGDVLFTPLTDTDNNMIGLLTVENPSNNQRPDQASVETLEIFANYAAVAIESARLFELEQQRRRLADTLRGVAEAISSQLEFDELLNFVLQALRKVVDYDSSSVQLLEEDRLVIIGGQGWEDSQQVIGLSFSMEGDNPNRLVIETQEPVIVKDAQQEYPDSFAPPHHQIRGWLGVPLTYGTHVLGLMAVDSKQANFFTEEDAQVVLAFANQVAVALQNAHLFDEARQQVRQLAALTEVAQALNRALDLNEVLNLVLDAVFDLLGHHQGSIWLIDSSSQTVKMANTKNVSDVMVELFNESAISITSEPFASVIKSGQVLVITGNAEARSNEPAELVPYPGDVTYVPLKTEDGVIGILAIEATIHHKNMLQLVTTLADLAAVAIDSARLLEDTRRHANEMQYLYNLGVEVSGMLDVQQVMRSVIGNALSLTATQVGTILLWDQETKRYMITGAAHPENSVAKVILSKIDGEAEVEPGGENQIVSLWCELTAQVMAAGQPLIVTPTGYPVEETERVVETTWVEPALPSGLRAVLGVPIQIQNQPSGAIFVGSLVLRSYNTHDVQLLSFVANQAAVAISNARLVQRLNLFNEELERRVEQRTGELAKTLQDLTEERDRVGTLYQITRELAASFDLDRMLTEALSLLNRAIGISQGTILLLDHDSGHLVYRAALGRDRPLPRGGLKTPFKLGFGLAGKVMEERQPRLVPDLPAEPDWIAGEDNTANRRSALAVPLITGEEVLGALMLFHPDVNYFNEDHLKLVTAAGAQVATAINNAELYRLITDQAERLGVMLRTQAAEAAKNQAILRGITDGVLVLDAMRNIVLINPKAAGILNIEAAALENQHIRQILGRSESPVELELTQLFYNNLLKALSEIESGERSAEFRVEGAHKAIVVTIAPVALGSETATSIVAVIRDISREAEIERLKNEFISTVSHELRTPMTSIKGYADLLVAGSTQVGALNPTQDRFVRVIQSNANRLTELVNDILEISRIETGRVKLEFEALDVTKIIRDTAVSFEGQRVKKPMHLSLDLPEGLPNVYADRARLTQILVNLIANAWQYTPEGGHITVRACKFDEHFVQIDVEDSGIGIVEKDIDYIFDRFFRSERPEVQVVDGTGLGLSITRMYIEMMGGKIWVKSTLDVGSTFSFTVSTEPEVALTQGALVDTVRLPKRPHALVIDDDPAVVQLLKSLLEKKGYLVLSPPTPQDALSIARHASKVLALIMLDILLKNADGFKLLEQLSEDEITASIPMIVTSLSMDENGQELAVDVVDYIATSFEEAQVLESVQIALGLDPENAHQVTPKNRVLVVDSNRNTVQWLTDALDASGYEVHRAFNSQQALDMAFNSRPDLMLINANMVDNQGETIISQLRQVAESKEIPIIAVTDAVAPAQDGNRITVLGKQSRIFTRQPFTPDILALELAEVSSNTVPAKIE